MPCHFSAFQSPVQAYQACWRSHALFLPYIDLEPCSLCSVCPQFSSPGLSCSQEASGTLKYSKGGTGGGDAYTATRGNGTECDERGQESSQVGRGHRRQGRKTSVQGTRVLHLGVASCLGVGESAAEKSGAVARACEICLDRIWRLNLCCRRSVSRATAQTLCLRLEPRRAQLTTKRTQTLDPDLWKAEIISV